MWGEVNEEMKIRIQYNSPVVITFAFLSLFALLADEVSGGWTNPVSYTHLTLPTKA